MQKDMRCSVRLREGGGLPCIDSLSLSLYTDGLLDSSLYETYTQNCEFELGPGVLVKLSTVKECYLCEREIDQKNIIQWNGIF